MVQVKFISIYIKPSSSRMEEKLEVPYNYKTIDIRQANCQNISH